MFKKNILKKVLMAAMAATLTFASVAPAYAKDITIHKGQYTSLSVADRFKAYQVFAGTPNDPRNPHTLTNITWGSGVTDGDNSFITDIQGDSIIGNTFNAVYTTWQNNQNANKGTKAELVARFLSNNATKSDFVKAFAKVAQKHAKGTCVTSALNGSDGWIIRGVENGYYLIVDTVAPESNESASSFILNTTDSTDITIKSSIPKVEKKVKPNNKGNVAQIGDKIQYELTGTVANNIEDYTSYYYAFEDNLTAGLTVELDTVVVKIDGNNAPSDKYTVTVTPDNNEATKSPQKLLIEFKNLRDATLKVTPTSTITVTYTAHLNKFVEVGGSSNNNSVILHFSNDPNKPSQHGKGTAGPGSITKTYVFALDITKYNGSETNPKTPLDGVTFVLKNAEGKEAKIEETNDGYKAITEWVDAGSGSDLITAGSGKLKIKGFKDGEYTLHEKKAPDAFDTMRDIPIKITSTINQTTGELTTVTPSLRENRSDATISDNDNNGIIEVTLTNYKSSIMPHTGGAGTTALYVMSITIGVAGIAGLTIALRKKGQRDKKD